MKPKSHMLTLTSKRVDESGVTMLYLAECSCGEWTRTFLPTSVARAEHADHIQEHLGPEAQLARECAL